MNIFFPFFLISDCSICSELYCRCLQYISGCAVWVHRRQCWLMYLLQLLPRLTQCLEHETKHNGNNAAAQLHSEWKQAQKKKKRSILPCKNKTLEEHTELTWFWILTSHCNSLQASWLENIFFFFPEYWECYIFSYKCCIIKAHQGSDMNTFLSPLYSIDRLWWLIKKILQLLCRKAARFRNGLWSSSEAPRTIQWFYKDGDTQSPDGGLWPLKFNRYLPLFK